MLSLSYLLYYVAVADLESKKKKNKQLGVNLGSLLQIQATITRRKTIPRQITHQEQKTINLVKEELEVQFKIKLVQNKINRLHLSPHQK